MTETHSLMGGKLHVYRRENSTKWQCSTFLGKNLRKSTREESLALAKEIAEDWYLTLKGKHRAGILKTGKPFKNAAAAFLREYELLMKDERSPSYMKGLKRRINSDLIPYFGEMAVTEITPDVVQEYRIHRVLSRKKKDDQEPKRLARNTIHQEIVALRHVLRTANRLGWLPYLPDLSDPFKASKKVVPRGWFSPAEYKILYTATRERAKNPLNPRWQPECEKFHDYVLFMTNSGLRPDEGSRLQFRDVSIVTDEETGERILEIEVRGKRGFGHCKTMPGAVQPFQRLKKRSSGDPTELIFGPVQRELLNAILKELNLKFDRDGKARTAYSFRHTYICMRLLEGADIYQLAKNCRTSVEIIQAHYASHIKHMISAAAINVRQPKPTRKKAKKE